MDVTNINFTETETALLDMFGDGQLHSVDELLQLVRKTLNDDQVSRKNLQDHISNIRVKISPMGLEIINTIRHRRLYYRQMRRISD